MTEAETRPLPVVAQRKVRYEELLPYEWQAIIRQTPVVYWPLGLIEWHGEHMAVGNDAVKAEALCLRIAARYGGIVYPPSYFGYERSTPWDPAYGLERNPEHHVSSRTAHLLPGRGEWAGCHP